MLSKTKKGKEEMGFTLIELITIIVNLGIIGGVVIPTFVELSDEARKGVAREVGLAMSSSITARHSSYLISGNDYNATDVINDTLFESGVNTPTVSGNVINLVSGTSTYTWTYIPRRGVDSAYLIEDSSSAFP